MQRRQVPVRLDDDRYNAVREWAYRHDTSYQQMIEDALDLLMNPVEGITAGEQAFLGRVLALYREAPEPTTEAIGLVERFLVRKRTKKG